MTVHAPAATPVDTTPARRTPWPYAALVSGLAAGGSTFFLAQSPESFDGPPQATTGFLVERLADPGTVQLGGTLALVGLAASLVFLLGLTRFHARHAPHREGLVEALRWTSIAFLGAGAVGALLRYVAASGVPGGTDAAFYSPEAAVTLAVLADQAGFGAFLPGLAVMTVVGLLAVRDRVLPIGVGVVALLLALASTTATAVLGLPYSAGLVWPLFAVVVGVTGLLTRRPA